MKVPMFALALAVAPVAGAAEASALLPFDITINFELQKIEHDCRPGGLGDVYPDPGDGNCGDYKSLELGETYSGYLRFAGAFTRGERAKYTSDGWKTYKLYNLAFTDVECRLGDGGCIAGGDEGHALFVRRDSIIYEPWSSVYAAYFEWNLAEGTGYHIWTDDAEPYFGDGEFRFSSISVDGLPSIPVPSSLPFLLAGIGAIYAVRRPSEGAPNLHPSIAG